MKYLLISFCLVLYSATLNSQSWISSDRVAGDDDINIIQSISDVNENTIVYGFFLGTINHYTTGAVASHGSRDYFIAKFNNTGALEWINAVGGTGLEFVSGGLGTDSNGNIFITGGFRVDCYFDATNFISSAGAHDIFLAKYNTDGDLQWARNIGAGASNQRPSALGVNSSNNVIIAGTFRDSIEIDATTTLYDDNTVSDYFYAEFDNDGALVWVKQVKASHNSLSGSILGVVPHTDHLLLTGVFSDSIFIEDDTLSSFQDFDAHLIQTDLSGNVDWIRRIQGNGFVYNYAVESDPDDNVYVSGYYNSPSLTVDSTDTETVIVTSNNGDYDLFVAKYAVDGTLQWIRTNGSKTYDKLYDLEFFNNEIHVGGYFADTMMWGGIELASQGPADRDMFIGSLDIDGNYRSANSYAGRNNSMEEAYSVSLNSDKLYTTIRSDADLLTLGDSIYTSSNGKAYIALGVIGCLPISVDNTIYNDVTTCYGDSTGSIQILASGGFGSPWVYSIDNGLTSSASPFYADLPAGDYQVVVVDQEGCAQTGPLVTLNQPDTLLPTVNYTEDILHHTDWQGGITITDGTLAITATGGTSPYTYTLISAETGPGSPQALGTFTFAYEDSGKYVVALNDINDCGPSETDTVEMNVVYSSQVGIEGFDGIKIKMYPNPTSGIFTLELPYDKAECPMEVLNMNGQVVLRKQIFSSSGMINETIDLSTAPKGLYLLRIDNRSLKSAIVVK